MQVWTSDIAKHGPWKHIVAVNAFGALMLGVCVCMFVFVFVRAAYTLAKLIHETF